MSAMDIAYIQRKAFDTLRTAKGVIAVAHRKPDGDTLGAAAAMLNFCIGRKVPVVGFCVDAPPPQYWYMPGTEMFTSDVAVFDDEKYDTVAVFDAGDLRYVGIDQIIAARNFTVLNFDHHATNERFGHLNIVDITASSTAEVVYRFLTSQGATIDRAAATCLMTGILTDTGNFTNPATTSGSLKVAADLLRRGAKMQEVSRHLLRNKPLDALRLWGMVLSRLRFNEKLGMASTVVFNDDLDRDGVDEEHVEGISNFLNTFLDAKVVMVLRELPDGLVKGSLRTATDIDVSAMAKAMGGGGHKKAAGFTIPGRIVEDTHGWSVLPPA